MTSHKILSELIAIKAIKIQLNQPFIWSSGWHSPIYCDNRLSFSFPKLRTLIKEMLSNLIKNKFPQTEVIAGVATAGIPQAALVADFLNLPMSYVRPKIKSHGMGNQIEGKIYLNQKIVLVEDLISTGESAIQASLVLREKGFEVLGVVAIFSYNFKRAIENFQKSQIALEVLSDYNKLISLLKKQNALSLQEEEALHKWRGNPETWGK